MENLSFDEFVRIAKELGVEFYRPHHQIFYHYTSLKVAQLIIENSALKFSSPSAFNDPYDLSPYLIDNTCPKSDLKESFKGYKNMPAKEKKSDGKSI